MDKHGTPGSVREVYRISPPWNPDGGKESLKWLSGFACFLLAGMKIEEASRWKRRRERSRLKPRLRAIRCPAEPPRSHPQPQPQPWKLTPGKKKVRSKI